MDGKPNRDTSNYDADEIDWIAASAVARFGAGAWSAIGEVRLAFVDGFFDRGIVAVVAGEPVAILHAVARRKNRSVRWHVPSRGERIVLTGELAPAPIDYRI